MISPAIASVAATDIRDAFFDEVLLLARADRRVMLLTDDQGAFALEKMRKELPGQYFNIGIAEQNLIDVAAGMALGGLKPFVCGISNFLSLRCCEQISVNLSAMKLPVTIVASGGGLTYASDGPTHHSIQDVAVMRTMPHFQVYNPADAVSTRGCARLCYQLDGPAYVRIEKGVLPGLYGEEETFADGWNELVSGDEVKLLSTGYATQVAMRICQSLRSAGVSCGLVDIYRIKPFDTRGILAHLRSAKSLAILEEQTPVGGIGSLLCETVAEAGMSLPLWRFHLPDLPCYRYGSREWLHREFSLDGASVAEAILRRVKTEIGLKANQPLSA